MDEGDQESPLPQPGPPEDRPAAPAPPPPYGQFPAVGGPAVGGPAVGGPAVGGPAVGGLVAGPPPMLAIDRINVAAHRRADTDYIFDYWTALGWTVLTFGIYGFYVFYQLVRRMRDHNARRVVLFDATLAFAWEEAARRGLQDELAPSFQRANAHMDVLRRMNQDFREPVVWLILAIVARGIVEIIAFVLLDQDLVKHDRSEVGVEYELSIIFGRFGQTVTAPDQGRVKGENNYVGRILATIFSFGIYLFWWYYNQMDDPNRHFQTNWAQEDSLVAAANGLRS